MGGKGSGRKGTGVDMAQFSVRMPAVLKARLESLSVFTGKSRSIVISELLSLALQGSSGRPQQTSAENRQIPESAL